MNLKKIYTACKKMQKHAYIHTRDTDEGNIQYINTGCSIYPLEDLPVLCSDTLMAIWSMSESERNSWTIESKDFPQEIDMHEYSNEKRLKYTNHNFLHRGNEYLTFEKDDGVIFINAELLKPIVDDVSDEYELNTLDFYYRETAKGTPYVYIKGGFFFLGIVLPFKLVSEEFCNWINYFAKKCDRELIEIKRRESMEDDENEE